MKSKLKLLVIFLFSLSLVISVSSFAEEFVCVDITPITTFHDGDPSETLVIAGGMSDTSSKILVPMDLEVEGAYVDITGQSINNESAMDMIILNDISASMGEGVENMKADTKDMIGIVLAQTYNKAGLVSFRTTVVDVEALTDNEEKLFDVVDTYYSQGSTCIACAIKKGIELFEERGTLQKVMVLLTNGEANICTYGLCYNPKEQAIEMAAHAWLYHGIKVYAVPYNDSSDIETLEDITEAGNGELYAQGTPMSDVYSDIEDEELFSGSPSDVVLDIGDDGSEEFSQTGDFLTTETVDFTSSLADLLVCDCDGCEVSGDDCVIDLKVSSAATGAVILDNLMITGCLNMTTECTPGETRECPNQEGVCEESYETCPSGGFWEGCDYSSLEGYEDPEETCDFLDNDCDGETDEEVENTYYFDNDNDGYGISGNTIEACFPPEGYVSINNDCDDSNPNIHPGATDLCDGIDNDCDGSDNGCGGGGGGGYVGPGGSRACGDGVVNNAFEDCEADSDCDHGYACESCECVYVCAEDWSCRTWDDCSPEGLQTRTCTDRNDCGTSEIKPSESQPCEYTEGQDLEVTPIVEVVCGDGECSNEEDCEGCPEDCGECSEEVTGAGLTGLFTGLQAGGILGLIALIIILGLLLFGTKRGKKKK